MTCLRLAGIPVYGDCGVLNARYRQRQKAIRNRVMYHTTDPQARMVFLLMAMVAMLFGVFALDFRRMLILSGWAMVAYLLLLAALIYGAPERVNLKIEVFVVLAYAVVLVLLSFLGSINAVFAAAERIRCAIAQMPVPELPGEECITISLGIAIHCMGDHIEKTVSRADEALYQAKSKGRNQVVVAAGNEKDKEG